MEKKPNPKPAAKPEKAEAPRTTRDMNPAAQPGYKTR